MLCEETLLALEPVNMRNEHMLRSGTFKYSDQELVVAQSRLLFAAIAVYCLLYFIQQHTGQSATYFEYEKKCMKKSGEYIFWNAVLDIFLS